MKKLFISVFIILCMTSLAFAEGRGFTSFEHPWLMRSAAALGRGNTNYVKSDDKYAPFYNPAGLARIKRGKVELIPLSVGLNTEIVDVYSDFQDTDTSDDAEMARFLADRIGELYNANVSFYPAYARKNFVLGVFGVGQVKASPANPVLPELNVDITADAGVVLGIGSSFMQDKLQVGIAGRVQQRQSYARSYTFFDIADGALDDITIDDAEEGMGFLGDIGVIYNFYNDGINPRVGMAINNFGANSMGDAKDIPYSVTVSAGISPSWRFIKSDIMIDIRDITKNYDEDGDWGKRISMGAEVRVLRDIIALRCGFHQSYFAYGFGIDLNIIRIDYAYYSEEVGAYAGQHQDKRHAVEFALGW